MPQFWYASDDLHHKWGKKLIWFGGDPALLGPLRTPDAGIEVVSHNLARFNVPGTRQSAGPVWLTLTTVSVPLKSVPGTIRRTTITHIPFQPNLKHFQNCRFSVWFSFSGSATTHQGHSFWPCSWMLLRMLILLTGSSWFSFYGSFS